MAAIGYISYTEEVVDAFWSNVQHASVTAFNLSERSPMPPSWSAKDLPGGLTQILNVGQIKQIECYPAESEEDGASESISDMENWIDWNEDLGNPNVSEDDWVADNEYEIELDNTVEHTEIPE
jgi:hypothetical protein